jgi:hypothetical protein
MAGSKSLERLNVEIAERESTADRAWFESLLTPEFAFRRANNSHVGRQAFLNGLANGRPGQARRTSRVTVAFETDRCAVVTCVVERRADDGSWEAFDNVRLFTRAATAEPWQLLGWANEPVTAGP